MARVAFIAAALALLVAGPALAGQPVELRPQLEASGPITLATLFDNAGAADRAPSSARMTPRRAEDWRVID